MSRFHPYYYQLGKNNDAILSLFLSLIILIGIFFSLITFNIASYLARNIISTIEDDHNLQMKWDKVLVHSDFSVTIYNLNLNSKGSNNNFFSFGDMKIKIGPSIALQTLFKNFKTIPQHRKLDTDSKSLDFILTKSITHIQSSNMNITLTNDNERKLFQEIFLLIFKKRIYPKEASLLLNNTRFISKMGKGKIELSSTQLQGIVHEDRGIIMNNYFIDAGVHILTQEYRTRINGNTHLYDVRNRSFTHTFRTNEMQLNRYLTLLPLHIDINTTPDVLKIDVSQKNSPVLTFQNDTVSHINKISSHMFSVQLKNILRFNGIDQFDSLLHTSLTGSFESIFNTLDKSTYYAFILKREKDDANTNVHVNIHLEGNETRLLTKQFLIRYKEQIIAWEGGINITKMLPYGTTKVYLNSPFVEVPLHISTDISFDKVSNSAYATIYDFKLHNIPQSNFSIHFNYNDKSLQVYEKNKQIPVIYSKLNVSFNTFNNAFLDNTYSLVLHDFHLKVLDGYLFNNRTIQLFSHFFINGTIDVNILQSKLDAIAYNITINMKEKDRFSFSSKGNYIVGKKLDVKGSLSINSSIHAQFETKDFNKKKFPNDDFQFITKLQYTLPNIDEGIDTVSVKQTKNNMSLLTTFQDTFLFQGNISKNLFSVYSHDQFKSVISFENNNLKEIHLQFNKLGLSGFKSSLNGNTTIQFIHGYVDSFKSKLALKDKNWVIFQTALVYQDTVGVIEDFILASDEDIFLGKGNFEYAPKKNRFHFEIVDTNNQTQNFKYQKLERAGIRKIQGKYDSFDNSVNIILDNISPSFFKNDSEGSINAQLYTKLDMSKAYLLFEDTELTLLPSNEYYNIHGIINLDKNKLSFNKVKIQRNEIVYSINTALLSNKKAFIEGTIMNINSTPTLKLPLVHILIKMNSKTSLLDIVSLLEQGNVIPDVEGNIKITPYYEDDRYISQQFQHNLFISSDKNALLISEQENKLYLTRNAEGLIKGRIGNHNVEWNMLITGILFKDEVGMRFDIINVDIPELIKKLTLQDVVPLLLSKGNIQGSIFMRGTLNTPLFYASIKSNNIVLRHPSISNDIIELNKVLLNINNNHISIPNTLMRINEVDSIIINGTGYINNYALTSLNLYFKSSDKSYMPLSEFVISNILVNGLARGNISLQLNRDMIKIVGDVYLKDAVLYTIDDINKDDSNDTQRSINTILDIVLHSEKGVTYYWPNPTFPLLKSKLQQNQKLKISYDANIDYINIEGNIALQSGLVYYFNKGFNIVQGTVVFDTNNNPEPFIENFEAMFQTRINAQNYLIYLQTHRTFLNDINFNITASPPLTKFELSVVLGTSTFENNKNINQSFSEPFKNISETIASFGDQISNIGIMSQFEQTLTQVLNIDYISFRTKILKNLVSSTFTVNTQNNNATLFSKTNLGSIIDGSRVEVGKYVDLIYFSFIFEVKQQQLLSSSFDSWYGNIIFSPQFNVEIPTPIISIGWSFNLSSFINYDSLVLEPANTVTLSWKRRY